MAFRNLVIPRPSTLNPRVDRADPALTYPLKSNRTALTPHKRVRPTVQYPDCLHPPRPSTHPPGEAHSVQDTPTPPTPGLLPTKRPAPPTKCKFCSRCFIIGGHWIGDYPATKQHIKPVDLHRLLRSARRAQKRSRPSSETSLSEQKKLTLRRRQWRPTHCRRSLWRPPLHLRPKGWHTLFPMPQWHRGGGCEIDCGGCHRPAVGVCDQQECQMSHCERHLVHMCETRFPI